MVGTLGIIQGRIGSTRLKSKLSRRLGGTSLLEWVVRRVTDSVRLDQVVVATGDGPLDDELTRLVPAHVQVIRGSETDVLGRFVSALKQFPARAVVRICADNPFIDPVLIDRLIGAASEHQPCDYLSYGSRAGRPMILSAVGLFAEWCRAEALLEAAESATEPADREHVTRYLYSHPERFRVRLLPVPPELDREDLRLTVDVDEDFHHADEILEALGHEDLEWQRIAKLLDGQPALRQRMADLNRVYTKV